jgi:ABC-type antimicrobial peptide transport system permease subunit
MLRHDEFETAERLGRNLTSSLGLYGLLWYEFPRRTREPGIRMALGSQRRDLMRLVLCRGAVLLLLLILVGLSAGVWVALGATRLLARA